MDMRLRFLNVKPAAWLSLFGSVVLAGCQSTPPPSSTKMVSTGPPVAMVSMTGNKTKTGGMRYDVTVTGQQGIKVSLVSGDRSESLILAAPMTAGLLIEPVDGDDYNTAKKLNVSFVARSWPRTVSCKLDELKNPLTMADGLKSTVNNMSGTPVDQVRDLVILASNPAKPEPGKPVHTGGPETYPNKLTLRFEPVGKTGVQ